MMAPLQSRHVAGKTVAGIDAEWKSFSLRRIRTLVRIRLTDGSCIVVTGVELEGDVAVCGSYEGPQAPRGRKGDGRCETEAVTDRAATEASN